jgi:hypothetical protein
VVIGRYVVKDGKTVSEVRAVEFNGSEVARHQERTGPKSGIRQRLFKTDDNRYIVSVATWKTRPREETAYSLHEIDESDLQAGGAYEALGQALQSEALDLETALTLQQALEIIGGEP